jgi:hypothetical protein
MKLRTLLVPVLTALALSGPAHAAVLTSTSGSPANVVTDYSAPALVSFDLDLKNLSATRLNFLVEEADLLGPLSLNAIIRNLSGEGFRHFNFALEGISFAAAGSVTPAFGTLGGTGFTSNLATIDFATPEWAEFHFGNPLGTIGNNDWLLNTAGLRAGDSFSITASVPEPSTIMLMLLAMTAMLLRANRNKR